MFFIATEAAECGRDRREFLVDEVRALGRIVMRQKDHPADRDQDKDEESEDEFHSEWVKINPESLDRQKEIDVTSARSARSIEASLWL